MKRNHPSTSPDMPSILWIGPSGCRFHSARCSTKDTTQESTLERRCSAIARGPRRPVKGHDRLMHSVQQSTDPTPPPPSEPVEVAA